MTLSQNLLLFPIFTNLTKQPKMEKCPIPQKAPNLTFESSVNCHLNQSFCLLRHSSFTNLNDHNVIIMMMKGKMMKIIMFMIVVMISR